MHSQTVILCVHKLVVSEEHCALLLPLSYSLPWTQRTDQWLIIDEELRAHDCDHHSPCFINASHSDHADSTATSIDQSLKEKSDKCTRQTLVT